MLLLTVAEVGLVPLNRSVAENETFPVCAQITVGLLGCNISVPLDVTVQGNSTIGMYTKLACFALFVEYKYTCAIILL